MRSPSSPESILKEGLKELSLSASTKQVRAFITYLAELKRWNKAYNLTSLKTDEDIIIKHFLDSLLYLKGIPEGEISVMDVGSGAGFPGIPLKIMRPEIMMYLLEPSRKKATFLIHIIKKLGLDKVEVIEKRIEEIKSLTLDAAVTRALFDIREFIKKAASFVRNEGVLILSKGPRVDEELKALGAVSYELLPFRLPLSNIKRYLVIIKKGIQGDAEKQHAPGVAKRRNTEVSDSCVNIECRLRKAGCRGSEGCPGFKRSG